MDSEIGAMCPVTLRAIQVRNYRTLRHVDLRLDGNFYVLVGPNGSGKSTLIDVVSFLFSFFENDLRYAIEERTEGNFQDLVWGRPAANGWFEIAVEFETNGKPFRYELRVDENTGATERAFMGRLGQTAFVNQSSRDTVFTPRPSTPSMQPVFRSQRPGHIAYFSSGMPGRSVRINIPDGHSAMKYVELMDGFPANPGDHAPMKMAEAMDMAICMRENAVQVVQLDNNALRSTYSVNGHDDRRIDYNGGNLPAVLARLKTNEPAWSAWIDEVSQALPGVEDVRTFRRPEDRKMYVLVKRDGVEVPSWGVSDGTLRFLALTSIPYLSDRPPVAYLLEEPENGIHPMAIEYAYQALSTVTGSQVFIASHSPTLLRCVSPDEVLCFGHDRNSGTRVVRGDEHPRLAEWQGSIDDGVFWASDILSDADA